MWELKRLDPHGIPSALEKALRYRMLEDPMSAESICLDVLAIEPGNQDALVLLILALSDQFRQRPGPKFVQATDAIARLCDEYSRAYYYGLLCERRGKVAFERGGPGSGHVAYEWFREAMASYERAAAVRPPSNDDAALRWNTCARILNEHPEVSPDPQGPEQQMLE